MAKVVYRDRKKSVFLSHVETALLFAAEFGTTLLDAFFPAKYPETWWTRRLLGLDGLSRNNLRVAKYRLIQRGLLAKRSDGSYIMTRQGQTLAKKILALIGAGHRQAAWDGKWRVLVFDVPEARRKYREGLRRVLLEAGYIWLQDSVWIGKHPLPDDAFEFIEACDLDRHIFIFLCGTVDKDEELHRLFLRPSPR